MDDVAVRQKSGAGIVAAHRSHQDHNLQHPVVIRRTWKVHPTKCTVSQNARTFFRGANALFETTNIHHSST